MFVLQKYPVQKRYQCACGPTVAKWTTNGKASRAAAKGRSVSAGRNSKNDRVRQRSTKTGCQYGLVVKHMRERPGFCMVLSPVEGHHKKHLGLPRVPPYLTRQADADVRDAFSKDPDMTADSVKRIVRRNALRRAGRSPDDTLSNKQWPDFHAQFPDLYKDFCITTDEIE